MSISYEYYKVFYYVARYRSFNKAAKVLLNSQPNITRAMNNLESELGCTLFERSHRGVTLTEQGEVLLEHVKEAHHQIMAGEDAIKRMNQGRKGSVSLGLTTDMTDLTTRNRILPPLRDFSFGNPQVNLRLINDSTPRLIEKVNEGELDMAIITTTTLSDPTLRENILYSFQEIPIAGNAFRDRLAGRKVSIRELNDYPLITMARDTESFAFHDQLFAKHGVIIDPYIETHTMRQALSFAESDMGIACLAEEYVQPLIDGGSIFRIEIAEGFPQRELSLIKNAHSHSRAVLDLETQILSYNNECSQK